MQNSPAKGRRWSRKTLVNHHARDINLGSLRHRDVSAVCLHPGRRGKIKDAVDGLFVVKQGGIIIRLQRNIAAAGDNRSRDPDILGLDRKAATGWKSQGATQDKIAIGVVDD